jgi:hypothetical protein
MRRCIVAIAGALVVSMTVGCQESRLRNRTVMQAVTVNDLYHYQVLNNLAMIHADSGAMPYFSQPNQGTNQNSNSLTSNYTPGWDFITAKGVFIGGWLFDKNTAAFGGTTQNTETWQTLPTTNPDKIYLLKLAYDRTLGRNLGDKQVSLTTFMTQYQTPFAQDYLDSMRPGWYCVGTRKEVAKNAIYVGHHGKTYVWVMPGQTKNLSAFTLAVLNIVTASPPQGKTLLAQPSTTSSDAKTKAEVAQTVAANTRLKAKDHKQNDLKDYQAIIAPFATTLERTLIPKASGGGLTSAYDELDKAYQTHLKDRSDTDLPDQGQGLINEVNRIANQVQVQAQAEAQPMIQSPAMILAPRQEVFPYPAPPTPPPVP